MYTDKDMTISTIEKAHWMAIATICDIYKSADGGTLTSVEVDDVHHCMEIMKDCYAIKELHDAHTPTSQS